MPSTTSVSSDTSTSAECTSPPTPGRSSPPSTTSPSCSSSSDPSLTPSTSPSPSRAAATTAFASLPDAVLSVTASRQRRVSNGSVSRSLFPSPCGSTVSRASVSQQRLLPAHRGSVPDSDPSRTASPLGPPVAPATCTGTSISGRVKRPCRQAALRGLATCARHTWMTDRGAAEPGGPKNTCVAKRAGCSRRCQNDPVAGLVFCPVHVQSECERMKVPFPPPTPIPADTVHPFARGVWSEPPPPPKAIPRRGKKRQRPAAAEDGGASDSDAANLESDSSSDTATSSSDASGLDFDDDVLEAFEAARTRNARGRSPTSDDTSEVDASEAERQEERRRMYAARFKPKPRPAYDPSDSEPEESEFSTDFTARQTAYFDAIAASVAGARADLEARLETLATASTQSGKRKSRVRPVSKVWERFKLKQPRWLRYGKPLSGGAVGVFKRAAVELRVTPVELSRICGVTASALEKRALFPVLSEPTMSK